MANIEFTEHALFLAKLAEYQDELETQIDQATIEYMHAQEYARDRLEKLRKAIDLRDAMQTSRKYIGGERG